MDELNVDHEDESIDSLGARLRKAREYKGLGVDSVAHQLNLSQQRVHDMENDDYRFAVAESYAKGYLRAYAKLLGLAPDLIILEFDRMNFSTAIQHHETKLISNRQISAGDRWMRWVTYSIGLLLVFLVAIWWRSQPNSAENGAIVTDSSDQSTTDISAQATRKADASDHQPSQNLGDEAGLLQKPEMTPAQAAQDPTQDSAQKTELQPETQKSGTTASAVQPSPEKSAAASAADVKSPSTTAQTPAAAATDKTAKNASTSKTVIAPKVTPKAADDDSDDEESDDDSDDDSTSDQQGFNLIKGLKPGKPGIMVGQREQDERALLLELEKVFGRG